MKRMILAGILLASTPFAAVVAQNWDVTYAETEGGHSVGNPDAQTSLIAFVSYSCNHCANFEQQSEGPMRLAFIQPGRLQLEVRHVIRNPLDLAAALTTECGPEDKFFGNHRAMMRDQPRWLEVAVNATSAQSQRWMTGTIGSRMRAIASDLDFYDLMERRGYSASQLDQCLGDEAAATAIADRAAADNTRWNIPGTPSFAVNGSLLEGVHSWDVLEPALSSGSPD